MVAVPVYPLPKKFQLQVTVFQEVLQKRNLYEKVIIFQKVFENGTYLSKSLN